MNELQKKDEIEETKKIVLELDKILKNMFDMFMQAVKTCTDKKE